jgi:phosphopantothenoylcysteine decarboxylase/phosphopantothenate--cysteine ligase
MSLKGKKVLVTCGPVWIRIDAVRVISNISSGRLGQMIAALCRKKSAAVTLLLGPVTEPQTLPAGIKVRRFSYFEELKSLLTAELKRHHDAVIHAAAVSDYRVRNTRGSKITSDRKSLTLKLTPNPKLIDLIKARDWKTFLVGFKLIPEGNDQRLIKESKKLFHRSRCNLVVANRTRGGYRALILDRSKKIKSVASSRTALANQLTKILDQQL